MTLVSTSLAQLVQLVGCLQTLVDLDPSAGILRINLALAVLLAAAGAVNEALSTLGDGADSTGLTQDALTAETASFFPNAKLNSFA